MLALLCLLPSADVQLVVSPGFGEDSQGRFCSCRAFPPVDLSLVIAISKSKLKVWTCAADLNIPHDAVVPHDAVAPRTGPAFAACQACRGSRCCPRVVSGDLELVTCTYLHTERSRDRGCLSP